MLVGLSVTNKTKNSYNIYDLFNLPPELNVALYPPFIYLGRPFLMYCSIFCNLDLSNHETVFSPPMFRY